MSEVAKILYIDDDLVNRQMIKRMLKSYGHTCLEAGDAKTGVSMAIAENPDVILMDYMMPDMNGIQTIAVLRQNPITQDIPIIMFTANSTNEAYEMAMKAGCVACLNKPISVTTMMRTITQVLETMPKP